MRGRRITTYFLYAASEFRQPAYRGPLEKTFIEGHMDDEATREDVWKRKWEK